MKASDVLKAGLAQVERGWCTETFAQDAEGRRAYYDDPQAQKFCTSGAALRGYVDLLEGEFSEGGGFTEELALRYLAAEITNQPIQAFDHAYAIEVIAEWNDADSRTQTDVLDTYRFAIKHALEDEAS